jgi:hypothetical protein
VSGPEFASHSIALLFGGGLGFVWAWAIWAGPWRGDICACCGLRSGYAHRHTSWCVEVGGTGAPKSADIEGSGS